MRKIFFLVVALLFFASSVLAISTDLGESYDRRESIIVEIKGNILSPILPENIELRRGHVLVPLDYEVKRLEDRHFLWMEAPNTEGAYRLIIKEIFTTIEGKNVERDFEQNFSVTGDLVDYSVKPGLVFSQEDFSLNVNLNEDLDKEIEVENKTVTLKPGENTIEFSTNAFVGAKLNFISIGKYSVPAYIIGRKNAKSILPDENVTGKNMTEKNISDEIIPKEEVNYECSELSGGEKCSASEICDGKTVLALDGNCCVGSCGELTEEENGTGVFIGFIIIVTVLVIALFIWYKYRKAQPKKSLVEEVKGLP